MERKNQLLESYITLLKAYNDTTNIYSKSAYNKLDFHIQDSVTLSYLISNTSQTVFDIGSGSGLPAIPIAIMNSRNRVYAIESKSRKTNFLEQVKNELELTNLTIVNSNVFEWIPPCKANIITAKAFSAYQKLVKIRSALNQKKATIFIPISAQQKEIYSKDINVTVINKDPFFYLNIA